jgi:NADPH-dependent curcumin reductase CurA
MWLGCKVIGIAGSDEKIDFITKELGFDHGINYKKQNLKEAVDKACPNGIDVFFDNVGGETLDIVLRKMNNFGRVSICGNISQYTSTEVPQGLRNESSILQCKPGKVTDFTGDCIVTLIRLQQQYYGIKAYLTVILQKRLKVQGFSVSDFAAQFGTALPELIKWYKEGKLKGKTFITNGFDNLPTALLGLLRGDNIGKSLVKL